ncbi:MAG: hypothetical protein ACLVLP_06525 [Phascolarctobacterium faecium]|uniref:hypothetical protein n=1 Tax=Phascolarctobacterium faecium TaxID=33025 RepID=UPI00399C2686
MTLDLDKLKQVREVVLYRYVFGIALAWLCFYHVPLSAEVKEVLTLVFFGAFYGYRPDLYCQNGR